MKSKIIKRAFTLVEMLIVVVIIGILIAALLPKFKGAQKSARDTSRKANLSNYATAIVGYFATNNEYPSGTNGCSDGLYSQLSSQMTSELKDPSSNNISLGTLAGGCLNGKYA